MKQSFVVLFVAIGGLCVGCRPHINVEAVDAAMDTAILQGKIPGGVVCFTADTGIIFLKAYGNRQLVSSYLANEDDALYTVVPDTVPMTTNTVFDLASLTKSVATTSAVMTLVRDSALDLNTPVCAFIPQFASGDSITLMHLLTHTSGLPAYLNATRLEKAFGAGNREALIDTICTCPRWAAVGTKQIYSCLNFITLQRIVEEISGQRFDVYCREHVFEPLGMHSTMLLPYDMAHIAPTELQKDSSLLCGQTHDPLARVMNAGISGNAGAFSMATDLARLAQYLLQNKEDSVVRLFTTVPDSLAFACRTPGWAAPDTTISYLGSHPQAGTYGHTGYTGTSMVLSPAQNRAVIILTNRVHPYDRSGVGRLRREIADALLDD